MGKTYKWDDKQDPRKDTAKAKHDKKVQGRNTKQFWRNVSTQDKE